MYVLMEGIQVTMTSSDIKVLLKFDNEDLDNSLRNFINTISAMENASHISSTEGRDFVTFKIKYSEEATSNE